MLLTVGYAAEIGMLRFSPEGSRLALTEWRSYGTEVLVLDVPSGKEVARYSGGLEGIRDLLFRSEGELIIFHEAGCHLGVGRKKLRRLFPPPGDKKSDPPAYGGALSPDGKTLAVGTNNGLVLLDVTSGRPQRKLPTPTPGHVCAAAFSPDGRYLAAGCCHGDRPRISFVLIRDLQRQEPAWVIKLRCEIIETMAFRPDNRLLAVAATGDTAVSLFRTDDPRIQRPGLDEHASPDFSSGYNLLYGTAWTEPVSSCAPGVGEIEAVQFSADGKILKAVCYGGDAFRFFAKSGRILSHARPADGHEVQATAVSDRGLAAGTLKEPQTLLLWDVPRWGSS